MSPHSWFLCPCSEVCKPWELVNILITNCTCIVNFVKILIIYICAYNTISRGLKMSQFFHLGVVCYRMWKAIQYLIEECACLGEYCLPWYSTMTSAPKVKKSCKKKLQDKITCKSCIFLAWPVLLGSGTCLCFFNDFTLAWFVARLITVCSQTNYCINVSQPVC